MASGQRIVVVGGLSETEQVLKAVLEPRGLHVERVRECTDSGAHAPTSTPRLVVFHDDEPSASPSSRVRVEKWEEVPHVIIGSAEFTDTEPPGPNGQFLQKPFHYRELIQAIERLLQEPGCESRAA